MEKLLIQGGTVVDGTGSAPRQADVLIEGDRIAAVGVGVGDASATTIDATGQTVMPGLIDAHCHLTFDEPRSNDELFFHRDHTLAALATAHHLPKLLMAGVTGVCDPDTIFRIGPSIRDAVEAGWIEGPRITTGVAALLTSVGGTAGRLIPDEGEVGYAEVVHTLDDMVLATRRQIKQGADIIKIHATGSIPTRSGELQVWSLEEMKAVCDTAHALGIPVTAHCRNASSTRDAALAGVDIIYHASFMDDEALEAVVESGAALCPVFTFLSNLCDHGAKVGAATNMVDIFRGEIQATAEMMRRAYDAGTPLLCGSESGFVLTPYGHWHSREVELFVEHLDLDPLQAIRCATATNALTLGLEGRLGLVEEDCLADVIVVDGDPTVDVSLLGDRSRLAAVLSRGRQVDLERPWPEKGPVVGSTVGNWAAEKLTREVVDGE
ncbi:MAG: amidohydrolase family protein [Actinomycetia bacterium]|nr:amidohydrolase family protein [Actinomycetes bacterium]